MKLILPTPDIPDEAPFKYCLFERKPFGDALINLIQNSEDELIISLDAKWGEGKTTFIKMWQGLLNCEQNKIPNIYINAFENDFNDDPFIPIAGAIIDYAKNANLDHTDILDKAKGIGTLLSSLAANYTIQKISFNTIDDLDDMKEKITEVLSDTAINVLEERLTSYSGEKELIKSFKEILTKISEGNNSKGDNEENKKPLIIIIDELDRCKPSYAVALIEKVKHIFSTKNVFFILVMHKEQLIEALKCVYGQGLDASTYLQKFIHIETTLPKKQAESNISYSDITKYCDHLYKSHALNKYQGLNQPRGLDDIKNIANHLGLSLRQMEKIFILLTLYFGSFPNNENGFQRQTTPSSLIVLLTVIKITEPILYSGLANKTTTYDAIYEEYRFSEMEKNNSTFYIQKIIYYALLSDSEFSGLVADDINSNKTGIHQWAERLGSNRKNIIPSIISKINTFTPSV